MLFLSLFSLSMIIIFLAGYKEYFDKKERMDSIEKSVNSSKKQLQEYQEMFLLYCQNFFGISEVNKQFADISYEVALSKQEVTSYRQVCESLSDIILKMEQENKKILELNISENQEEKINYCQGIIERLEDLRDRVESFSESLIGDENNYGIANRTLLNDIQKLEPFYVIQMILKYEMAFEKGDIFFICSSDLRELLEYIWFFAMDKPFSSTSFKKAENLFVRILRYRHEDILLAEWYAKKRIGGEDVLKEPVQELLGNEYEKSTGFLTKLASGFMWMKAYETENMILQYILTSGKQMPSKMQNRLHALTTSGKDMLNIYDVKSTYSKVFFDISVISWKEDKYLKLFEELAFQDKLLTYSLAIRDDNKDVSISHGIIVPGIKEILDRIKRVFADEYGSEVSANVVKGIAMSGNGEEELEGILVRINECKQLGMFLHFIKIGKKFGIKFYILFMPENDNLDVEKQHVLSLYKKLSPSANTWEDSLKTSILLGIQQLFNQAGDKRIYESEKRQDKDIIL